jgi:phosphatidate cytidylyltransferase
VLVTRIATAAVLVAGLLAALFFLPRNTLALVVALLLALGGHEWGRLCRLSTGAGLAYAAAVVAAFLALAYLAAFAPVFSLAALFWIVIVPLWLWRGVAGTSRTLLCAAGMLVLVPAGLAMLALRPQEVVLVVALVSIADTAAYFTGRALGRHKLAPSISPGKTWEGAGGALVGVLAYAIICGLIAEGVAWLPFLAAAALLTALGIVGDLFESAAKRQAGVKDSGAILPGHGGMLDRIDSATATLPVAALMLPLVKSAA